MANASDKRIHLQNCTILLRLRLGFLLTTVIWWCSASLRGGRSHWTRDLIPWAASSLIGCFFWRLLSQMGRASWDERGRLLGVNADLSGKGLVEYLLDYIYLTWIVHLGVALVSRKVWMLYLVIPIYAFYRMRR